MFIAAQTTTLFDDLESSLEAELLAESSDYPDLAAPNESEFCDSDEPFNSDSIEVIEFAGAELGELSEDLDLVPVTFKLPRTRGRTKVVESLVVLDSTPRSIYEALDAYGLLRKVTDIVMAKVTVPWYLRADASQEIHCAWAALKAKPTFARNQLAHYAYLSGQHAALKLRRTIGAVVVIPGALFRTGRDSSFMESIGAAVNPKDVEDYKDSLELSSDGGDGLENAKVTEPLFRERLGGLNLSVKQKAVAERALLKRMSVDDIATEMETSVVYVERMLNQITAKLRIKDTKGISCPVEPLAKRAPKLKLVNTGN